MEEVLDGELERKSSDGSQVKKVGYEAKSWMTVSRG
jgi:hypothetical protein